MRTAWERPWQALPALFPAQSPTAWRCHLCPHICVRWNGVRFQLYLHNSALSVIVIRGEPSGSLQLPSSVQLVSGGTCTQPCLSDTNPPPGRAGSAIG